MSDPRHAQADELLKQLTVSLYDPPYDKVRREPFYPDLDNPLHLAALLIDAQVEMTQGGVMAFLEAPAGRFLPQTIDALERIGAPLAAQVLRRVQMVLEVNGVTLQSLQADATGLSAFQLEALRDGGGRRASTLTAAVAAVSEGFDPLVGFDHREAPWSALVAWTAERLDQLRTELARRRTIPPGA